MARIRTIKPDFWRDEDLSKVSPEAALLAIGLLNHADDEGYFNAHPKLIESDVFPLRELSRSITVLIQELEGIGYLSLFLGSDGKRYGLVVNFAKHQVINKPTPSKIKGLDLVPDDSGKTTVGIPSGSGKEWNGKEQGKGKESAPIVAVSDIVTLVKPKKETDPMFFRFWEVYDYRVGKQKALKAWKSIKPDEELAERIIAAAELYSKANPTKTYYKHASTWLNGRHWEDDPATLVPKIARQAPQLTAQQATKLAASRTIFGDERTFHDQRTIDITPPQIAG